MIGLIVAIIIFNFIAFKFNKRLTLNQIINIWVFTIAFRQTSDVFLDFKYHAYWYFTKDIDWIALPFHLVLIPSINMMFLNWFPFRTIIINQILYITIWVIGSLIYELIALLPDPWGYFHYGWWKLWYDAIADPILFLILLAYYKLVCKAEKKLKLG